MQVCPSCREENPDRFRLCGFCGTPLAPHLPPQEVRKTVTVVFSDLAGSTDLGEALDSEALREVLSRYFDAMRDVLELHGGTVEKYIGDAIMAVFGLPTIHEDDALRAVRAAAEMQRVLAVLNDELERRWGVRLRNRTGVNTGEVVAGDSSLGQRLVTGDAVNVAARLEQAAPQLEVLVGESTYRLVRHAVDVEAVDPLALKGKSERVPAYLLRAVRDLRGPADARRSPLVGREQQLDALNAQLDRAVAEGAGRLATVIADAGVGKSRLIDDFTRSLDGRAVVLGGRCLPYGRGITFWPLVEIVRQAAGIADDDSSAVANSRLRAAVGGDPDVAERVASLVGLGTQEFPLQELFWAARRFLEQQAAETPVVAVFEDIHWAEATLLDLIEHLVEGSSTMLILCAARPNLLEIRPTWRERGDAELLELKPLAEEASAQLIQHLLAGEIDAGVEARIVAAAEGNPLYVEQIVSMLVDDGMLRREHGRWSATVGLAEMKIPPTIHALLAARLDSLAREERVVLECASVIGLVFSEPALGALVPEALQPAVSGHLDALSRKQLVRPEAAPATVDSWFRFDHILVRDAAYQGLLKRTRATLHERFADWAESVNRERERSIEFEEIQGYHLEQAYGYLAELGRVDDHGRRLASRASEKLAAAGYRAFARGDMPAAANLLRRSVTLLEERDRSRLELLPVLSEALMETGEFGWADLFLKEALAGAELLQDERLAADATLTGLLVRHHVAEDLEAWRAEVVREAMRLIPALERDAAAAQLAKAWRMIGFVHGTVCRFGEQVAAVRRALEYARLAGDARLEARLTAAYTIGLRDGPTPAPEAIERCEELIGRGLPDRQAEALALCSLACLRAMQAEFETARELYMRGRWLLGQFGGKVLSAFASIAAARVELLAGDIDRAERVLRDEHDALASLGERYFRPLVAALLAHTIYLLGDSHGASEAAAAAEAIGDRDDVETQAVWRGVRAKLLARSGNVEAALRLAKEAIERLRPTDAPVMRADAMLDLADVLDATGRAEEARAAILASHALYTSKGNIVRASQLDRAVTARPA